MCERSLERFLTIPLKWKVYYWVASLGGPAAKAGLQEGDVIIEFAGQSITNIYDYTYALDAVKVDELITVIFMRAGDRHEVTMTPTARP